MVLIVAEQLRGITRDITITDSAGDTITPGANDRMRVMIARLSELGGDAEDPTGFQFLVVSGTPSANGSSIVLGAANRVRLDAQDLATIPPGIYSFIVDYFDRADASEWKTISTQVLVLGER